VLSHLGLYRKSPCHVDQQYQLTTTPQNCVSSCICSRGWLRRPSMGEEALAKIICPSIGECQGQEVGVGGLGSRAGGCLLYTSPSPRDCCTSRMPSSA
jgi:hypothetical protein